MYWVWTSKKAHYKKITMYGVYGVSHWSNKLLN